MFEKKSKEKDEDTDEQDRSQFKLWNYSIRSHLFIYLKDKTQFTLPHSIGSSKDEMHIISYKDTCCWNLALTKQMGKSGLCLFPRFSHHSAGWQAPDASKSISSRSTLGILGCWKPSIVTPQTSFMLVSCCVTYLFALLLTAVHIFKQTQMPFAHCQMAKFKGCL